MEMDGSLPALRRPPISDRCGDGAAANDGRPTSVRKESARTQHLQLPRCIKWENTPERKKKVGEDGGG